MLLLVVSYFGRSSSSNERPGGAKQNKPLCTYTECLYTNHQFISITLFCIIQWLGRGATTQKLIALLLCSKLVTGWRSPKDKCQLIQRDHNFAATFMLFHIRYCFLLPLVLLLFYFVGAQNFVVFFWYGQFRTRAQFNSILNFIHVTKNCKIGEINEDLL